MQVVIIEDEEDIRAFLRKALTMYDPTIEIVEAGNGMEAVKLLAGGSPDGIILDMLMPDMDGWEFLQVMEAMESDCPVVILTAVHRDNASLCGIMTTYDNVIDIENKPIGIQEAARILDTLKQHRKA
jgi:DNA-binding response OmpR family regulator